MYILPDRQKRVVATVEKSRRCRHDVHLLSSERSLAKLRDMDPEIRSDLLPAWNRRSRRFQSQSILSVWPLEHLKVIQCMNFTSMGDDAVDESKLILCCAVCCANVSLYPTCDCFGCSGKVSACLCPRSEADGEHWWTVGGPTWSPCVWLRWNGFRLPLFRK